MNSMLTDSPFREMGVPSRRTTGTVCTTETSSDIPMSGRGWVGRSLNSVSITVVSRDGSTFSEAAMASGVKSPFQICKHSYSLV